MSIVDSIHVSIEESVVWKLGIIIDDKYCDGGLYKVYVPEYKLVRKFFITDMRVIN